MIACPPPSMQKRRVSMMTQQQQQQQGTEVVSISEEELYGTAIFQTVKWLELAMSNWSRVFKSMGELVEALSEPLRNETSTQLTLLKIMDAISDETKDGSTTDCIIS